MKAKHIFSAASLFMTLAMSCVPETAPAGSVPSDGAELRTVRLNLAADSFPQLKSSLGSGIESLFTGAMLAVYSSSSGALELECEIPASKLGSSVSVSLPASDTYDMYLVGNLRLVGDDGRVEFPSFPLLSSEIGGYCYRLDGGDAGNGLRREYFSEVASWGIPLCWSRKGIVPEDGASVDIIMERLFSKVVLTVDHSGIAGTSLDAFVNGSVHVRQSNCALRPFAPEGSRAEEDADIIPVSDYDAVMDNALLKDYVFYVPENRQGELMPGNTDPGEKDMQGVESACGESGISRRLTYLEFAGNVDSPETGLEGEVVYRFFLGRNALTDFDIERNKELRVSLHFDPESVFDPDWKLDSDNFSDTRRLYLSGDLAGPLPEGKEIYVRKNRPGSFNLNIDTGEGGENLALSALLVNPGYKAQSLTELAWTSDFWSADHDTDHEPGRTMLGELGIAVTYEDGRFTFSVTDPGRFVPGRRVPLKITMFPGGMETTAMIVTAEDLTLDFEDGKNLQDNFFLGQRRALSLGGTAGSKIYYAADQDDVAAQGFGKHRFNRQWKTVPSEEAAFPGCVLDKSGNVVCPYMDYESYSGQYVDSGQKLDIYAFYPNHFSAGKFRSSSGKIILCTDDIHNDGIIEVPVKIRMPWYDGNIDVVEPLQIPVDGKEVGLDIGFYTAEGGEEMDVSDFDDNLYELLLKPQFGWDAVDWYKCIRISEDLKSLYLFRTTLDGRRIEKELRGSEPLGRLAVRGNAFTGLYPDFDVVECNISLPGEIGTVVQVAGKNYFNEKGTAGKIRFEAPCEYVGGDVGQVDVSAAGPAIRYECAVAAGETYGPELEFGYSGGKISMTFDETRQVRYSSAGEFIPGGLLVPYGDYRMTLGVTNRWDGRRLEYPVDFTINYSIDLKQFTIFSPKRYATIVLTGEKNAEYLKMYGPEASPDELMFLLESVGTRKWNEHLAVTGPSYYIKGKYHLDDDKIYHVPPSDFDVKFFNANASTWSASLSDAVSSQRVMPWLNSMYFHKDGVLAGTSAEGDEEICGSKYISLLRIMPADAGYIYRGVRFDWK